MFELLARDGPFDPPTTENIATNSHQNYAENDSMENENTAFKSPPIFVKGVEDFPALCTVLIELIGVDNFICKSSTNSLKIQTMDPNAYRALVQYLKSEKAEYQTYQLKEDKPLRIVICNLHPSTPLNLIKEELKVRLYEVRQVTNVLHKVNKNPLPLFFVDLEPTPKSFEIFKMTSLLHCKIKIEEPFKPKTISQCFNCQQYEHTRFLLRLPSPLRSLWSRSSIDRLPEPTKCPSEMRSLFSKPPSQLQGLNNLQRTPTSSHPPVRTFPNHPSPQTQTYAQSTSNTPAFVAPPPSTDTQPPDLSKLLTNFLDEFKNVINPLISLLTKIFLKEQGKDTNIQHLTESIKNAIKSALSPENPKKSKPRENSSLPSHLIKEKYKARRIWQKTRKIEIKKRLNQLTRRVKWELDNNRFNSYKTYLSTVNPNDASLWNVTKRILEQKDTIPPLKSCLALKKKCSLLLSSTI
ncbi:hypothetical protein QTP88_014312 [Uroleucon formosanum]